LSRALSSTNVRFVSDSPEYRDALVDGRPRGRGAGVAPGNRYESLRLHVLGDHLDEVSQQRQQSQAQGEAAVPPAVATQVFADATRTLINPVDSPDLGFRWSINPYRGCEHGCIYCYARPDHERLGFNCGLDFETKIFAKFDAPKLLRKELGRRSWQGEPIMMAGVTDVYQPIEAGLKITRGCLEVLAECRQPVSIVTKNRLILRDLDLLAELSRFHAVSVAVSITTLDNRLASRMEPRASSPGDRLEAVRQLSQAGVPTTVMVAPIIPAMTDREIPGILQAAAAAGATGAGYVLLRLPHQVKALFLDWLGREFPQRAGHVQALLRSMRDGDLYDATFGTRMRGRGAMARQVQNIFKLFIRRCGLDAPRRPLSSASFRRPQQGGQMSLFEG
jgi:DNA repair photolyase